MLPLVHGDSRVTLHLQRALQVQDFLMRVRSQRFPSIEKDMQMLVAHCGSLFLDPAVLAKVTYPAHAIHAHADMLTTLQADQSKDTAIIPRKHAADDLSSA